LTAGKQEPVLKALQTMVAMRRYMRGKSVNQQADLAALSGTGMSP